MNTMKTGKSENLHLGVLDERTIKKVDPERLLGKVISVTFNESKAPLNSFLVVDFDKSDLHDLQHAAGDFSSREYYKNNLYQLGMTNEYHLQLIDVVTSKPYDCFSSVSGFLIVEGWMVENSSQFSNRVWVPNFYVVCEEDML